MVNGSVPAIREGIQRAQCVFNGVEFDGNVFVVKVKKDNGDTMSQLGQEYDWQNYTFEELKERVRRFCQHFINKQNYYFGWGNSI